LSIQKQDIRLHPEPVRVLHIHTVHILYTNFARHSDRKVFSYAWVLIFQAFSSDFDSVRSLRCLSNSTHFLLQLATVSLPSLLTSLRRLTDWLTDFLNSHSSTILILAYSLGTAPTENTALLLLRAFASAGMFLPSRWLAMNYSGLQALCHNTYIYRFGWFAEDNISTKNMKYEIYSKYRITDVNCTYTPHLTRPN
jgi:hypothetical protein